MSDKATRPKPITVPKDGFPTTAHCPDCGAVGMDYCERVTCSWDRWDDGTRVTAKQRADGASWAAKINEWISARDGKDIFNG